jgi:hypothetical protein
VAGNNSRREAAEVASYQQATLSITAAEMVANFEPDEQQQQKGKGDFADMKVNKFEKNLA